MAGNTTVKLIIDTEGNVQGISDAQNALSSLGESMNTVRDIALGMGLEDLTSKIMEAGQEALAEVPNFEEMAASLGGILKNVGNGAGTAAEDFSAAGGLMQDTAQKTADEMRKYSEKVAKLNDDLSTALQGQNVIDAQQKLTDQLDQLADNHATKIENLNDQIDASNQAVIDRQAQREMSLGDKLQNMKDAKANSDADKAEKLQMDLANASGDIQRKAIQKKFDEEKQLADDSFNRKLTTAQTEGQTLIDQQTEQDKKATATKVANLQDQIAQENTQYDAQAAKLKEQGDDQIAKLQADNTKKIALVRQELADEEITHKEALEHITDGAKGAGQQMLADLLPTDAFAAKSETLKQSLAWLDKFAPRSPFQIKDIVASEKEFEAMGVSGEKMIPIIGNISAAFGQSLGTGTQAVLDGINGRMMMLKQNFGITSEELAKFNNGMKVSSKEQFLEAMEKLEKAKFPTGMNDEMGTFNGRMSNLKDNVFRTTAEMMGLNTVTGDLTNGGVLDMASKSVLAFSNYLGDNKDKISAFFINIVNGAKQIMQWVDTAFNQMVLPVLKMMINEVMPQLTDLWNKHGATIIQVAEFIGGVLMVAIDGLIVIIAGVIETVIHWIDAIASWIEWGEKYWAQLKKVADQAGGFGVALKILQDVGRAVWDAMWNDFKGFINHWIDGINILISGIDKVGSKIPGLSTVKIPPIPHLATGTDNFQGGMALVGENGPELVSLPQGSRVTPNNQLQKGTGKQVTQYITINGVQDIGVAIDRLNYAFSTR